MLLAEVLQALQLLISHGYYDGTEDIENILKPLSGVLNGFSDIPFFIENPEDCTFVCLS